MRIDTGSVVAWDESVTYDVAFVGSIKSAIFGGEGIFLTTLTGPGTVIVQTMTLAKLRRMLGVQGSSEDSGSLGKTLGVAAGAAGVGGILGSILGGEDG